jgi:hypothetical protein
VPALRLKAGFGRSRAVQQAIRANFKRRESHMKGTSHKFATAPTNAQCTFLRLARKPGGHGRIFRYSAFLVVLWLVGNACAQPLAVEIFNAQYATFVSASVSSNGVMIGMSRQNESFAPISDRLTLSGDLYSTAESRASAGLFQVEAFGTSGWGHAYSTTTNQLQFYPVADQTQMLSLQFSALRWYYCSGSVSLYDVTAGSELWNYNWAGSDGTVPWVSTNGGYSASALLNPETDFLSSHQYELTMTASASSASDTDQAIIQLTGLQAIPEPASVCLFLMALPGWLVLRRKCVR